MLDLLSRTAGVATLAQHVVVRGSHKGDDRPAPFRNSPDRVNEAAQGETALIDFIHERMPLAAVPAVPEIRLHGAVPSSRMGLLAEVDDAAGPPYWGYQWAGGLALARYLMDHRETVRGLTVLDVGTGSGVVAISASLGGAIKVVGADVDHRAATATQLNCVANHASVTSWIGDATIDGVPSAELILVGDLFYDLTLSQQLIPFLDRCVMEGSKVLIGDPGRRYLPLDSLRLLADYEISEVAGMPTRSTGVFVYLGSPVTK